MRLLGMLALLAAAGCNASPASLGITGPSTPQPPQPTDDSTIMAPGIPAQGNTYGPSITPSTSGGRYFNYN